MEFLGPGPEPCSRSRRAHRELQAASAETHSAGGRSKERSQRKPGAPIGAKQAAAGSDRGPREEVHRHGCDCGHCSCGERLGRASGCSGCACSYQNGCSTAMFKGNFHPSSNGTRCRTILSRGRHPFEHAPHSPALPPRAIGLLSPFPLGLSHTQAPAHGLAADACSSLATARCSLLDGVPSSTLRLRAQSTRRTSGLACC